MPKTKQPKTLEQFIKPIDFKLLKKQTQAIYELRKKGTITIKEAVALDGLINLLDYIKDTAVDECGYKPREVFYFTREK